MQNSLISTIYVITDYMPLTHHIDNKTLSFSNDIRPYGTLSLSHGTLSHMVPSLTWSLSYMTHTLSLTRHSLIWHSLTQVVTNLMPFNLHDDY